MVRCPTEIDLLRFVEGNCSAAEADHIEEHRSTCPRCEDVIERATDDSLLRDVQRVASVGELAPASSDWFDSALSEALERYRVVQRIGAGGMGVVYEAEQVSPRRRVAIKVVRSALLEPGLRRRFATEVEALGRLEHPGIARVLEADTFELHGEERPFFAMELVDGTPLDDFVRERSLDRRARLELFLEICAAMTHAHQKGVLHRDLKPSNILVTREGHAKILDFGVSRTLDAGAGDDAQSLQTMTGQIVGTLAFMSPEQMSGDPDAIDTRSDVYSLGVLLFRLLSGRMPYELAGKPAPEIVRIVSSLEPARLRAVDPRLPADLDTIAGKALEKDRERRYATVDALADDVRRHLNDEPIAARPPSRTYQLGKFVRRNKGVVAGLALAFLSMAAGVAVSLDQARRARAAEEVAREEARTEERVNEFLSHLLGTGDPDGQERPATYTIEQALVDSESWLEEELAEEPLVEATVRVILGTLVMERRQVEQALRHLTRALELRMRELDPQDIKIATAYNALGTAHFNAGDSDAAERCFRSALAIYAIHEGDPEVDKFTGTTHLNVGILRFYAGDHAGAGEDLARAIELHRRSMGARDPQVARDLTVLSSLKEAQGDMEGAIEVLREAVAIHRESSRPNTMAAAQAGFALALKLEERDGREAFDLHREVLAIRTELQGPDDPWVGIAHTRVSRGYASFGQLEIAREHAERAVEILRGSEGYEVDLGYALCVLGQQLKDLEEYEAALDALLEARDRMESVVDPDALFVKECAANIVEVEARLLEREIR